MDLKTTGVQVKDLADSIKRLLARWADKKGVTVQYHRTEARILFNLKTEDGMVIEVDYDINQTSKEYISDMIKNILCTLSQRRKERHDSPIIIL